MRKPIITLFLLVLTATPAFAEKDMWVTSDRLNRRTCPSEQCGVVGVLMFREKAIIYEEQNGWGRLTQYYDASCKNGKSEYVDAGNPACDDSNGIVDGRFAEWVFMRNLNVNRPDDPSSGATGDYALIAGSDDYRLYKDTFAKAASSLISSGRCSEEHFLENGGWIKSSMRKDAPIYFMYCGDFKHIYLNAKTGEIQED